MWTLEVPAICFALHSHQLEQKRLLQPQGLTCHTLLTCLGHVWVMLDLKCKQQSLDASLVECS